jgi:hypothetical protein
LDLDQSASALAKPNAQPAGENRMSNAVRRLPRSAPQDNPSSTAFDPATEDAAMKAHRCSRCGARFTIARIDYDDEQIEGRVWGTCQKCLDATPGLEQALLAAIHKRYRSRRIEEWREQERESQRQTTAPSR